MLQVKMDYWLVGWLVGWLVVLIIHHDGFLNECCFFDSRHNPKGNLPTA